MYAVKYTARCPITLFDNLLDLGEEKLIRKIILRCERFVYNMEDQFLDRRFKPRKPSQRQRIQLSVLYPSLQEPFRNKGFRPFPTVKKRFEEIELVCKPLTYNSLKTLPNVGYLQKTTLKEHSKEFSSTNTVYYESDYLFALKELVSHVIPRSIIFYKLLESNILLRYVKILIYSKWLMCKHLDVNEVIKVRKERGIIDEGKELEAFREGYANDKNFLKDKTNSKILFEAERFAVKEIQNKSLEDALYTRFFITGGISYGEIELLRYEK